MIEQAYDRLVTVSQADRRVMHGWCLEAVRELYRRMVQIGDFPGALRAVKLLIDHVTPR